MLSFILTFSYDVTLQPMKIIDYVILEKFMGDEHVITNMPILKETHTTHVRK
jgi:hypothetical protein